MNSKRIGRRTVALQTPPSVLSFANIGGRMEGQGPLAKYFDELCDDSFFGEKTWEKAEATMQRRVLRRALEQAGLKPGDVDYVLAGDLLNQCIGSSFGLRELGIPFFGLYGACSTMGEALALASLLIDGGFAETVAAQASSHFCTAERQYRMPVPYGSQRSPTAQWTATAAGCTLLSAQGPGPYITHVTCGKIVDQGITDPNNMGAAMAPAAYDTLRAYFADTHTGPADYDAIFTGDLGELGHEIVMDLFRQDGVDMTRNYEDCGMLLYKVGRMAYLNAFLCGGLLCAVGQILIDRTRLTPARILTGYVVAGVFLSAVGLYQPLADWGGAGATVPLTGFGHALAKGVEKAVAEQGWLGVLTGGLSATAGGITTAVVSAVVIALIFKPGDKR